MHLTAYLDAATAPPPFAEALDAARRAESDAWGDPAGIGPRAEAAAEALETARHAVATLVAVPLSRIHFTSGATEANNLTLKGLCAAAPQGKRHLLISTLEPYSLDHPARTLARQGWEVGRIPVDAAGHITPEALADRLRDDTFLVSITLGHPGIGTVQDLEPLARLAHTRGALIHTDASVAAGLLPVRMAALGVDALSLSGRRLGGTAGAGALILTEGLTLKPLIEGGTHEDGLRPGVPALGPVAAMGAACRRLLGMTQADRDRLEVLGRTLRDGLSALPGSTFAGDPDRRLPGHASACLPGLDGEALVTLLADAGVAAATGSACATRAGKPDPAFTALGFPPELARGSLVLSAWWDTRSEEADAALAAVGHAVDRLRSLAPAGSPR